MITIADRMEELKIIPVVTLAEPEDAVPLASALINGGIPAAEVTCRTAGAFEGIQQITEAFPNMLVGAGTVLNIAQVDMAVKAGAKFIVSPGFDSETVQYCQKIGIPIFPGCITASEVQKAISLGLKVLKFFPAEQSGGLKTLKALSAPFSAIRWMPTGGIQLKNLAEYLKFSKIIACGGSYMVGMADIQAKNWDKITEICRETIRTIQSISEPDAPAVPSAEASEAKPYSEKKYDIVTLGEVLMRMSAFPGKRISDSCNYIACIGGSELNVCAGMARLGCRAGLIACLPKNDIGTYAICEMQRMGVGCELISLDSEQDARLGVYYFEGGAAPRKPKVTYDRSHSSGLKVDLNAVSQSVYSDTKIFHTTGISLALPEIRNAAVQAIERFHAAGAQISFDINYRANLWDEKTALQVLSGILPYVDILFISEESLRRMFHKTGTLQAIIKEFAAEFNIHIIATSTRKVISEGIHSWNSIVYSYEKDTFFTGLPYEKINVIDRIGSGDAFDAGVLYGYLKYSSEQKMVDYGNAMAALKCTIPGDLPDIHKADVETILEQRNSNDHCEMIR